MTQLNKEYDASLDNRRVLSNGSVKYDLEVECVDSGEVIVDTSYTVSKRQEDPDQPGPGIKEMVRSFAEQRCREHEQNIGKDVSGDSISI
jgi:hypothetical protein